MISWTVAGTTPRLTGITEIIGSSSSSRSGTADGTSTTAEPNPVTESIYSGSASSTVLYTFLSETIHGTDKSTTSFSWSNSQSYTETWELRYSQYGVDSDGSLTLSNTGTLTYSNSNSSSASSSGQTTAQLTALIETSTTETYETVYWATYTTTVEAYEGQLPLWTTSQNIFTIDGTTKTAVAFVQSYATSATALQTSYATREATSDVLTTLDQTTTLFGLPDTVVQAETRNPHNAEIVYVISAPASEAAAYSAATNLAQSGTRFTLSPIIVTAQRSAENFSRPTSSIASNQQTSLVVFARSTATQQVLTGANYSLFPPSTVTTIMSDVTTTNTTWATNVLSFQNALTFGGTTNTVTGKNVGTYWKTESNQIGTRSFQTAFVSTTAWTITLPIEAAPSSSTQASTNDTFGYGIFFGVTTGPGELAEATYRSSGVSGNTLLPTVIATTGVGGQPAQSKYGTIGAAIGSEKGGWITANASSDGFVDFTKIYALDGSERRATTMFPVTNQYHTVNATGITWTKSTSAVLSIDGATSKATTTSASFGVLGETQTTSISQTISYFGGQAGLQETFVQTAVPGVYKNRVNGATTFFNGAATLLSNGASDAIASWEAIKNIRQLTYTTIATPIVWVEPRNSEALPPAMPPNA